MPAETWTTCSTSRCRRPTHWSFKLPESLYPGDFVARAKGYPNVEVTTLTISDKTVFRIERAYGDRSLVAFLIDIPVRMPASQVLGLCRDLEFEVSKFGLELADM